MDILPQSCITFEEHAALPSLGSYHPALENVQNAFPAIGEQLRDVGTGRLAEMDKGHVAFQIISQASGVANWRDGEACKAANDELAEVVHRFPSRLGGFAALCMAHPEEAAQELERAVTQLGFFGGMLDNHLSDMTTYDAERFWPVFGVAERLDVPLYIHPAPPSDKVIAETYRGNYADFVAAGLATGSWGWHENVGLHILKLFGAGVFHRFPKLKVIIGHFGEMLPMMIDRVDHTPFFRKAGLGTFKEVWERNIWVTTSGVASVRTLGMLLKTTSLEHVLYSIDTPFVSNETGWEFMKEVAASGLFSKTEMEQFVTGNAKKLFKLR